MSDISEITLHNGETYSLKDAMAREHLVPENGSVGQVLTKTSSGAEWADAGGGGGGEGQSYTVTTSGNVTINITDAEGTPALSVEDVPDVHGGIEKRITAIDISDTSATAEDVVDGKVFYTADGKRTEGAFGGRKWVRPAEFPDLSKMDISGEVLYMSYMANEANGFCTFRVDTNGGQYTVEIGDIVDDEFVAENTYSINSGAWCQHYFGSPAGGYKVLRVTGSIKAFINQDNQNAVTTVEGEIRNGGESGLVEMYGNLPGHNEKFSIRIAHYVQSIVVRNISPNSLLYSFQDSYALQNIETKTWDMTRCTSLECAFRACQKLQSIDCADWNTSNVTTISNAFQNCFALTDLDVSKWNTSSVTNMSFTFNTTGLKSINVEDWVVDNVTTSLDLSKWSPSNVQTFASFCSGCYDLAYFFAKNLVASAATTTERMFRNCKRLMFKNMDISEWDMSNVTNIQDMFSECYSLEKFPLYNADLSSVTNSGYILSNDQNVFEIVVPASLTTIGDGAFRVATRGCPAIHFKATTPPTLKSTNAFTDMNYGSGRQIVVPYSEDHSILNAYKTATNWSTYAQYIVEESE